MQKFIIFLLVVLFSANLAEAKSTEDVPFFKTYQVDLQLDLYKGEPFMITSTSFELVYPTEKSTRYLPSYSFYLSDDDELEELNLYYRDKRGKKKQVTYFDLKVSENNSREYFVTGTKKYTINFFKLEAGVNVILEYTVTTDELHYFSPFYFNRLLDTRNLKYSMQIPKDMQVKLVKKYLDKVEMEKETLDKGKYRYITYEAKNRDEIEFYNDGPDFSFYTPHILPILEKYKNKSGVVNFLSSPSDLYNYYTSIVYSQGDLGSKELTSVAEEIKQISEDKNDIIKNTYNWVQRNIRYIAYEKGSDGVIPRAPALVCNRKFGDCKDMSNLIRKLLELNDIESQLTWIGTRSIPYRYEEVYSMNVDNHMIASLKKDGEWLFLDATDPNGIYGLPTSHIQGKQAMISIDANNFDLVEVPVPTAETNVLSYNVELELDGDELLVHADLEGKGMVAGSIKNTVLYTEEKEKEDFMKDILNINSNKTKVLDYELEMDKSEHAKIKGDYEISSRVRKIGDSYILNPFVNKIGPLGTIDLEEREVGMEMGYNKILENTLKIKIPKDYEISNIPESFEYKKPKFSYVMDVESDEEMLVIHERYKINSPNLYLDKDEVVQWNELVKELKKIYKNSIKFNPK